MQAILWTTDLCMLYPEGVYSDLMGSEIIHFKL